MMITNKALNELIIIYERLMRNELYMSAENVHKLIDIHLKSMTNTASMVADTTDRVYNAAPEQK